MRYCNESKLRQLEYQQTNQLLRGHYFILKAEVREEDCEVKTFQIRIKLNSYRIEISQKL